jgi:hypothetical protein
VVRLHTLKRALGRALRLSAVSAEPMLPAWGRWRGRLGVSVSSSAVRAILVERGKIRWAGQASYTGLEDLAEVVARLAGESGRAVQSVRVVLERDVLQLRSLTPAPPLKGKAVPRWVALEAQRLFRKNGAPLVTDGVVVPLGKEAAALWAAAAPEPVVRALLDGCAQAGLGVESLGPASDVLPRAFATTSGESLVVPNGGTAEVIDVSDGSVWRSRLVRITENGERRTLVPALISLGEPFAPVYAGAVALPKLQLLPADTRAARDRVARRRLLRVLAVAIGLWVAAGTVYTVRLLHSLSSSVKSLHTLSPLVDGVLRLRRDLDEATRTLATLSAASRDRSRHLSLVAAVTRVLDDSTHLVALKVGADGMVRLVGYAPRAARVLAELERVNGLSDVRLEGPVTRETGNGTREMDRFAIVARLDSLNPGRMPGVTGGRPR